MGFWDISGSWVKAEFQPAFVQSDWRKWRESMTDPFRPYLFNEGTPDLDAFLAFAPRPTIPVGMNPEIIQSNVERLETDPVVDLGHPFLDMSVKVALAHIDATFQGDHPKYGTQTYAHNAIDGFPQTIIAVVDALTAWGLHDRAKALWRYWLRHFVNPDGTLAYAHSCLGEYGQLLHTAALLAERAGADDWWEMAFPILDRMAEVVLNMYRALPDADDLVAGQADEDRYEYSERFFHANAWLARGMQRWARLCQRWNASPTTDTADCCATGMKLGLNILDAVLRTWPDDEEDWWLPPSLESSQRPRYLTDTLEGSYSNYRYYPELLSSGVLPDELANRLVDARLRGGGEFGGASRFRDWTDNWPMAEYLDGLWSLNRSGDFFYSLYGHLVLQQDRDHFTTCEQLSFPPGKPLAPYCLVTQLVPARAARLIVG